MDDLRTMLQDLAADAPLITDVDRAITEETRRRRGRRRLLAAAVASGVAAAVAVALLATRGDQPTRPTPSAPLPLVQRVPVTAHTEGDLAYVFDGGIVRRTPSGGVAPWVRRGVLRDACEWQGCDVRTLAWSPDGSELAFVMGYQGRISPSHFGVYLIDAQADTPRKVFTCPQTMCQYAVPSISWAPDGSALAVAGTASQPSADLVVVGLPGATPAVRPVCQDCGAIDAVWSPDGRWLAYAGPDGIRRISVEGGDPEDVDPSTTYPASLAWSPDGTRLLVETGDDVRVLDLSRRPYTQVTLVSMAQPEGPGAPAWSPDGTRVSWFSTPGRHPDFHAELWTAPRDGGRPTRLIHPGCCVSDWSPPIWSPDGSSIALGLGLTREDPPDLLVVDATDGREIDRLAGVGWGPMAWQGLP
jgi:dipeptidyl aminopeptidase/acylaminoacyl peptidase